MVVRIRIGRDRFGRPVHAAGEVLFRRLVVVENGEFRADLGAHRGDGAAVGHRQGGQPRPAEFDAQVRMTAPFLGDVEEHVLAADMGRQFALEFVAYGLGDRIPDHALGHGLKRVDRPGAARRAIEGAGGTGMGIGADQQLARPREAVLRDHHVANAVLADIEEILQPELLGEGAPFDHAGRILDRRRRDAVIEDQRHPVGVEQFLRPVPEAFDGQQQVELHHHVGTADCDVAGPDHILSRGPGQDFFDNCTAQGSPPHGVGDKCHRHRLRTVSC